MLSVPVDVPVLCKVCGGETRSIEPKTSPFSGSTYQLRQCPSCWYSFVVDPPTDYATLYGDAYYRGEGADPLTDYEAEISDPNTFRLHEWRGILRVAQSLTTVGPDTRWLDLGCGLGGLVRHLRQAGIVGAVGSEDGYARTRALELGVPCLTSAELGEHEGTFDIVTSIEVIEHVSDPLPFLRQVVSLLRPGGLFFFTTGNAQPQRHRIPSWAYVIPEIHVSFFEPATIDDAFERVGLTSEHHGFLPGFDEIIRYKTVKNLPAKVQRAADRLVPWKSASPIIDRRYGVTAFAVGRKPVSRESTRSDYQRLRDPKQPHGVGHGAGAEQRIAQRLTDLGIPVDELHIDVNDYRRYREQARYSTDFPDYYSGNLPEKSLEHYVAAQLLDLHRDEVYIDIASQESPVPAIYTRLFGVVAYRQDLAYPDGLIGDTIGGSATDMPLPSAFADNMALHCSFEHFEGLADTEFIAEAGRVLKPGGKCCIAPLYLAEDYGIQTDPVVAIREDVAFEPGATLFGADGWGNRHGRFYDPEAFKTRVHSQRGELSMTVFRIVNFQEVDPSCYARFALLMTKPAG